MPEFGGKCLPGRPALIGVEEEGGSLPGAVGPAGRWRRHLKAFMTIIGLTIGWIIHGVARVHGCFSLCSIASLLNIIIKFK